MILRNKNNRKIFLTAGFVLLFIVLASSIVYEVKANNNINILPPFLAHIPLNKLPQAKLERLLKLQQSFEEVPSHPRPTLAPGSKPVLPTSEPMAPPPMGTLSIHAGPFPAMTFTVRNAWQGVFGDKLETVYAGGTPINPATGNTTPVNGALRIYTSIKVNPFKYEGTYVGSFSAPNGTGPLTITAINGSVLQLRTDTGTTLTFDLQTNQYK